MAPFGGEVAAQLDDGSFGGVVGGADEALSHLLASHLVDFGFLMGGEIGWGAKKKGEGCGQREHTRLATVPLMLAIITILPPLPNLTICFAAACAVIKHPVTFTLIIVSQSFAV